MRSYFLLALALFSLTNAIGPPKCFCPGSKDKHFFEIMRNEDACYETKEEKTARGKKEIQDLHLTAKTVATVAVKKVCLL